LLQHRRQRVVVSGQSCCFRLVDLEAPIQSVGGVVPRFCVFCALPVFSDGILDIRRCFWWFRCGGGARPFRVSLFRGCTVLMVLVVGGFGFGWIWFWPNCRSFFVVVTALLPSWWLEVLTWRWVIGGGGSEAVGVVR
jgi:hypothetical protein